VIYVTDKPNDRDMAQLLGKLAVVAPIPFGDCVFFGKSEDGEVRVLIERKKVGDMANSVVDGRYLNQARAAHGAGFSPLILIVEGHFRPNKMNGLVETPHGDGWSEVVPNISYTRFDTYLDELGLFLGVIVKRSLSVNETVAQVKNLWQLFQRPPSEHQSLKQLYTAPAPGVLLSKPTIVRRVAKELDGIGWERSIAVADKFKTIRAMVNANVDDWQSIPGIGKKTAVKVVEQLNGGIGQVEP